MAPIKTQKTFDSWHLSLHSCYIIFCISLLGLTYEFLEKSEGISNFKNFFGAVLIAGLVLFISFLIFNLSLYLYKKFKQIYLVAASLLTLAPLALIFLVQIKHPNPVGDQGVGVALISIALLVFLFLGGLFLLPLLGLKLIGEDRYLKYTTNITKLVIVFSIFWLLSVKLFG